MAMNSSHTDMIESGRGVLAREAEALASLSGLLDASFARACELVLNASGRTIITGMGKSGHIAQKIAASLASTGTAAHFLHPAEGVHGDVGSVSRGDVMIAISFSGETAEILNLMGPVGHIGVPVISITGNAESTLARMAEVSLCLGDVQEADEHNLVPTTSTTLTLALGDAMTIAIMQARGFTPEDFAVFHPLGSLGRRLTLKVTDLLRGDETNPVISEDASFSEALSVITRYTLGGTCVVGGNGKLTGIITDGDVRRIMNKMADAGESVADAFSARVADLMTADPTNIGASALAYDALKLMENHQPRPIFILPVVDSLKRPVGMLHLHALVQAGFKARANGSKDD